MMMMMSERFGADCMNSHHHINAICLPLITTEQYAMNGERRGHAKKKNEARIFFFNICSFVKRQQNFICMMSCG